MLGDDRPSDLGDQATKKKNNEDLNYSGKTEWRRPAKQAERP